MPAQKQASSNIFIFILSFASKKFGSPWEMLDEMRSVRLVRLKNRKEKVSEFVGKQVDIFDEFGFDIPKGYRPTSKKKMKSNG